MDSRKIFVGEKYLHFENKLYQVLAIATHTETGEPLVIYQALYGERGYWVRPASMWLETVTRDGQTRRAHAPEHEQCRERGKAQRIEHDDGAAGSRLHGGTS